MWDRTVAGNKNTLSVLNGYADVGELAGTSTSKNTIHILHGKLDVGSITNANFTLNLLAGGTGQFNLAQADDNTSGTAGNDELRRAVLNFESGSQASFTIATLISTNGADARNYWADNFTVGDVQIDGVNVTDLSGFAIDRLRATLARRISLDFDPPTPNPATFSVCSKCQRHSDQHDGDNRNRCQHCLVLLRRDQRKYGGHGQRLADVA